MVRAYYARNTIGVAAMLLACCRISMAGPILIGAPGDASNFAPFGSLGVSQYQQVYSAALFSGPTAIDNITFFHTIPSNCGGGACAESFGGVDYSFSFSTTSKAVNSLDTTLANNIGPDEQLFFMGVLSGTLALGDSFTVTGTTPFMYDPSAGNLLLNIAVISGDSPSSTVALDTLSTGGVDGIFSRAFSPSSDPVSSGYQIGLVTEFNTPEPSTLFLTGAGVLGALIMRKRLLGRTFRLAL